MDNENYDDNNLNNQPSDNNDDNTSDQDVFLVIAYFYR